jgi:hemoglobin-like flavoprotein
MGNAACVAKGAVIHADGQNGPGAAGVGEAVFPSLGDGGEITPTLNKICVDSWELLTGDTCTSIDVIPNFARLGLFSAQVLQRLSEYPDVFAAFKPRTNRQTADTYSRYILMYRLVRYMLSVKDSSLKIKQQLRLMGRNHMRIGVTEEQTRIFNEILLMTIEKQLGHYGTKKILSAWRQLLKFIEEQFFFDKITFITHFTQDPVGFLAPVAAMHRNSDQMLSENNSVQSSVNLYRQNEEEENELQSNGDNFQQPVENSATENVIGDPSGMQVDGGFFTDLSPNDEAQLAALEVPHSSEETERILTLRQTRLLDSTQSDPEFNAFATLGAGSFGVCVCSMGVFLLWDKVHYVFLCVSITVSYMRDYPGGRQSVMVQVSIRHSSDGEAPQLFV